MMNRVDARQKKGASRLLFIASSLVLAVLSFLHPHIKAGPPELNRNRSIYVPVRFEACEHMSKIRLSLNGEHAFPLGKRIFLFTYYADKRAVLPELVEVRIEGEAATENGVRQIRTNLLVTPDQIVSSADALNRGQEEIAKQLRSRRTVRLPESVIQIKCEQSCTRAVASRTPPLPEAERAPPTYR